MKNLKKALIAGTCSALLVAGSVAGTMAWLQDTDEVVNTFTVGNVQITLDELDVDNSTDGGENDRDKANEYNLMPGHVYTKDPIVHFQPNSEASWLFVKVENDIVGIESKAEGYVNINTQMEYYGWTALDTTNNPGVYYKNVAANKTENVVDYPVFDYFAIDGAVTGDELANYATQKDDEGNVVGNSINVIAYAIQSDGIATAADAWAKLTPESQN